MIAPRKRWKLLPPAPSHFVAQLRELPLPLIHCVHHRVGDSVPQTRAFLDPPDLMGNQADPFRLRGMSEAVARIRRALGSGERIGVHGDYDADGVAATALLTETLRALGGNVHPYIPHRIDEGYGLHAPALKKLAQAGCSLVITVDCGIRAVAEAAYAKSIGLDLIITDHHALGAELPAPSVIICPDQPGDAYPFKELTGVGLAYKLAQALLRVEGRVPITRQRSPDVPSRTVVATEESLLDLVAIGTVADVGALIGENRILVRHGLEMLRTSPRVGLRELIRASALRAEHIDAEAIGFVLAPRLNAAGRIGDASPALRLLLAGPDEVEVAEKLAQDLEAANRQRQELMLRTWESARQQVLDRSRESILFAAAEEYPPGVIGLAAARLCDEFYRPAVVVQSVPGGCRGSARSIPEFDITAALDECRDLLTTHGGHALAAGFTLSRENVPLLEEHLRELATRELLGLELQPQLMIDAELKLADLVPDLFTAARRLEPFGRGNPPPTFLSRRVEVREARVVGESASGGHLRLRLADASNLQGGRVVWDAIAFNRGAEAASLPSRLDIVFTPQIDHFAEEARLQLEILDFKSPSPI